MAQITLTEADNGKVVDAHSGDEIVIRLPENPTTGYRWGQDSAGDAKASLSGDTNQMSGTAAGGGGARVLTFQAKGAGDVPLRLKLWRAWEGDASVTKRFAVTVRIA